MFSPTPSHIFLRPAPEPPPSTTGVGKSKFSPKASATINGVFELLDKIYAENPEPGQRFGASVAIEDGIIVVEQE